MSPRKPGEKPAVIQVTEPSPVDLDLLAGTELAEVLEETFGEMTDERLEAIKGMQAIARIAADYWVGLKNQTFYVLECKKCWEVSYTRAGANGIKGESTWARTRCPGCNKKWKLETVNVLWKVPQP